MANFKEFLEKNTIFSEHPVRLSLHIIIVARLDSRFMEPVQNLQLQIYNDTGCVPISVTQLPGLINIINERT